MSEVFMPGDITYVQTKIDPDIVNTYESKYIVASSISLLQCAMWGIPVDRITFANKELELKYRKMTGQEESSS